MAKRPASRECSLESIKEEEELSCSESQHDEHYETPRTSLSSLNDDDYISVVSIDEVETKQNVPGESWLNEGFDPEDDEVFTDVEHRSGRHSKGDNWQLEMTPPAAEEMKTAWKTVLLVSFINYLIFLPVYTLTVVNYNYLISIDPDAPAAYYNGWMRSLMRIGHAIGSAIFAVHCYTTKSYRPSLIVGRVLSIGSCLLYGFIETFPEDQRRWPWLAIFFVQDMAQASNIIFRSYVARLSTHADRQTACAFLSGAEMIAIVTGPGIQALAEHIKGDVFILEWLKGNKYTAPIWICVVISILTLLLILICFREPGADDIAGKMEDEDSLMKKFNTARAHLATMSPFVLTACLTEKCIGSFGSTTILTLAAPFVTATFNDSNYDVFLWKLKLIAGCSSIVAVALFMLSRASQRLNPVLTLAFALLAFLAAYAFSYPWMDAFSQPVVIKDVDHEFGCNSSTYSWCEGTWIVNPWAWTIVCGVLIGIAVPLSSIGFDTIYSRELGNIDQNIMQAMLVVFVDLVMAFVPILATVCFKEYGPNKWWLVVVGVMAGGLTLLIFLKPRLKKQTTGKILEK